MPKRIEHKIIDGIECKRCAKCKLYLSLSSFHTTGEGNTWDGLFCYCISCTKDWRNNDIKKKALIAYEGAIGRTKVSSSYVKKGIKVNISYEDFSKWFPENYFRGGVVDRIDNEGDYEIGNMQIITPNENSAKARPDRLALLGVKETFGRYCLTCKKEKSYDSFYRKKLLVNKWNPLGLSQECSECARLKRRLRYQRRK